MKILFISLGCDKNLADSETMLGLLASRGYQIVDTEASILGMPSIWMPGTPPASETSTVT